MRTYRETHGKPYVALAQHIVESASAHKDAVHMKRIVKHLLSYAIGAGKMPLMPRFPCNSTWISRGDASFLGHEDHRVVDDGAWCYPSTAGFDTCFPGEHYTDPFTVPRAASLVLSVSDGTE